MPQHCVWILLIHFPISNIILQFCSDFCAAFAIENASSICVCIRAAYHMSICVYGYAAWAARDHRCVGTEDGVRCTHLWHNRRRLHTPCGPPRESDGEASTWYFSTWHTVPSDDDVWYSLLSAISTKNVYRMNELSSHWHTVSIGWYVILCVGASLCVWDFLFSFFFLFVFLPLRAPFQSRTTLHAYYHDLARNVVAPCERRHHVARRAHRLLISLLLLPVFPFAPGRPWFFYLCHLSMAYSRNAANTNCKICW